MCNRSGSTDGSEAGFTLLEVTLALMISGLVLLTVVHGLGVARSTWTALTERSQMLREYRNLYQQLYMDLHSLGRSRRVHPATSGYRLRGDTESLAISTVSGPYHSGRADYHYDASMRAVLRSSSDLPATHDSAREAGCGEDILIKGVAGVRFEYFAPLNDSWVTSWNDELTGQLPKLIKVEIRYAFSTSKPPLQLPSFQIEIPMATASDSE